MRRNQRFITSPKSGSETVDGMVTVILLSENPGHRMKSYGPPALVRLGELSLLDMQIHTIKSCFKSFEIIICSGFDSEKIIKHVKTHHSKIPIRVVENQIYQNSNSCESARLCINNTTNDKILLCNGDLLIKNETISLINDSHSCVLVEKSPTQGMEIGVTCNKKDEAENFCFGISNVWSEITFLNSRETVESFRKIVSSVDYKNKFVFEALNDLIKTRHKLKIIENETPVIKIDNIKTYHNTVRESS